MKSALEDVKVVEYGNFISAPYCGKLLADLGAEVIKIEGPNQGDTARRRIPFLEDVEGNDRSGLFLYLNTNKLGVTLNLNKASGREIFKKLVKNTDILIEDTNPGKMGGLGLGYSDLKLVNPSLVMTSITSFGQTGPYKDYEGSDLIAWHMGGAGYVTPRWAGTVEQEPLRALRTASFITGITAAVGTMCALHVQRRTKIGQQVDVSHFEALIALIAEYVWCWPFEHRSATRASKPAFAPVHFFKCADGFVYLHAMENHHWQRLVEMMGKPEWANEELFKDGVSRGEHWESLEPLIADWIVKHTKAELFESAKRKKIPLAPVNSIAEVVENNQFKKRNFFVTIDHPKVGKLVYPGAPYKLTRTPWNIRSPAPFLGQHNEEVYCNRLGYTKRKLTTMREAGII